MRQIHAGSCIAIAGQSKYQNTMPFKPLPTAAFTRRAVLLSLLGAAICAHADPALQALIQSPHRTPAYVARDVWRHPLQTLEFFGIQPQWTVVELSPGAGWYTEILAPYLRDKGQLVLSAADPATNDPEPRASVQRLQTKLSAQPALYDRVQWSVFEPPDKLNLVAPGTADLVLTFRNVHNWMKQGEPGLRAVFASVYAGLKPGGTFGVVEHRLPAHRAQDATASTGYVHTQTIERIARSVGFVLAASSEINANPKDTADHVGGVWALPPGYVNKEVDRGRYAAIGESDRMTLRFVKP
jgi:predicted methyltransferase